MAYIPHTEDQRHEMLGKLGLERVEQLFEEQIPPSLLLDRPLDVPPGMSELELRRHFQDLATCNQPAGEQLCFLGAGIYDHYVPSVVPTIILRGEFHTAYTPYQPEMSQGTLQSIFEFQTMVCALTGMDVANASMYDGATAFAEAVILACGATNRDEALLLGAHPAWVQVTRTSVEGLGIRVDEVPTPGGIADREWLERRLSSETAVVAVQQPNFLGCIEDLQRLGELAHGAGALFVVGANPIALGLLEAPGALGADVVVGEGQPLGLGMNFGGPLVGFFAARKKFIANAGAPRLPHEGYGRPHGLRPHAPGAGAAHPPGAGHQQHLHEPGADDAGGDGLPLPHGQAGSAGGGGAVPAEGALRGGEAGRAAGLQPRFAAPFFHEFVLRCPGSAQGVADRLAEEGILAGLPLGRHYPELEDCLLVAVTEKRTKEEIDRFAAALG